MCFDSSQFAFVRASRLLVALFACVPVYVLSLLPAPSERLDRVAKIVLTVLVCLHDTMCALLTMSVTLQGCNRASRLVQSPQHCDWVYDQAPSFALCRSAA